MQRTETARRPTGRLTPKASADSAPQSSASLATWLEHRERDRPATLLMTLRTSDVAVCCSSDFESSCVLPAPRRTDGHCRWRSRPDRRKSAARRSVCRVNGCHFGAAKQDRADDSRFRAAAARSKCCECPACARQFSDRPGNSAPSSESRSRRCTGIRSDERAPGGPVAVDRPSSPDRSVSDRDAR